MTMLKQQTFPGAGSATQWINPCGFTFGDQSTVAFSSITLLSLSLTTSTHLMLQPACNKPTSLFGANRLYP